MMQSSRKMEQMA